MILFLFIPTTNKINFLIISGIFYGIKMSAVSRKRRATTDIRQLLHSYESSDSDEEARAVSPATDSDTSSSSSSSDSDRDTDTDEDSDVEVVESGSEKQEASEDDDEQSRADEEDADEEEEDEEIDDEEMEAGSLSKDSHLFSINFNDNNIDFFSILQSPAMDCSQMIPLLVKKMSVCKKGSSIHHFLFSLVHQILQNS